MNDLARSSSASLLPIAPRVGPIATRAATMADLPFLDALQKQHGKALGFFPRAQMEGYVQNGWVLVAEDAATKRALGYCASRDRYLKRDELGVVYQLCVVPGEQRKLVGASLIKAVFERSAYGCRLYCCWCAQDLAANHFWESLGFVPIAFRGGSGKKKGPGGRPRVHIFWQRRIREGDTSTPWWFPSKTDQGAIREDRLVFPIPPGTHWKDVQAIPLPAGEQDHKPLQLVSRPTVRGKKARKQVSPVAAPTEIAGGGLRFATVAPTTPKARREPSQKPKVRIDPRLITAARELRDRYLEHVNGDEHALRAMGKYEVSRLPDQTRDVKAIAMLPAA
jgi:hypothetical protein